MNDLKNKTVFITGTSAGIGEACAIDFAKAGANLILAARRISKLKELANKLVKEFNIKVLSLELDVRDKAAVKAAITNLPDEWKTIDILINNAGLARGFDRLYEGKIEDWEEMIDTNIKGLLYVTRQVLPGMVERKSGHIINIGSTAGYEVYINGNVYCATKYAVKALSQSIRLDVLDKNIRVSSVSPGMAKTEFSDVRFSGDKEKAAKVYEGVEPLTAEDVSASVLFCAMQPPHVNINEIILTSINQASSAHIHRKNDGD